jgi:hypothetical protein
MPRTCTVCRHARRHEIEADLQARLPYRAIAQRYSISKDAISRHRAHVTLHATPALAGVTRMMELLDNAEAASTWNFSLLSVQEARRCFKDLLSQLNVGIER